MRAYGNNRLSIVYHCIGHEFIIQAHSTYYQTWISLLNKVTMLITKSSINIVFQHNMCDLLKLENIVATINVLLDENKKLIFRV